MAKKRPEKESSFGTLEMFGKIVNLDWFAVDDRKEPFLTVEVKKTPVIVFPITTDGRVVVVNQYRYGARNMVLELPGGEIENDQAWKKTTQTELKEETGYHVEESDLTPLWSDKKEDGIYLNPALSSIRFLPVLAEQCKKTGEPHPDPNEYFEEQEPILLERWLEMIVAGEVVDAKSIVTTVLALRCLPNQKELARETLIP